MVKTNFVKPKKGLKIAHPSTGVFIEEKGEVVEASSYWTRRLNDGDVDISEEKTNDKHADKEGAHHSKKSQGGN